MEVQNHGIVFENIIIQSITGISKDDYQKLIPGSYTSAMDIHEDVLSDKFYSIKVSKNGNNIDCGDIIRFLHHLKTQEFVMLVGCWKQSSSQIKSYYQITEFHFTPDDYTKIIGSICMESLKDFVEYVKSIPAGKEGQIQNSKIWKEKRNLILKGTNSIIKINAKIDSKNQRRVQCSLSLRDLITSNITHNTYNVEYKGIELPYKQISSPRFFNKV